jgi:glutamyl-tRNA synthetase
VVDDHLMEITHVLRGEEWINSAPKHKLLYEYFGWQMPRLCHLPLLRNPDKSKLSKRKNPTSILYYQRMGYLPEALLNYLGRMGWSMRDEREKFTLADMVAQFDIQRVSLGGPIFDMEKLSWLNGLWIREELDESQLAQRLVEWAFNRDNLMQVLPHVHKRMETLSDFAPLTSFLVSGALRINEESFASVPGARADTVRSMQFALWKLEALRHWTRDTVWHELKDLADALGVKVKDFIAPLFIAIAGSSASISVVDSMALLGPDMSRARIRHAIEVLGGVSKKTMKQLEKEYQGLSED